MYPSLRRPNRGHELKIKKENERNKQKKSKISADGLETLGSID